MREVVVRQGKSDTGAATSERLVSLLAAGLERLVQKQRVFRDVDFRADESVTTTCPNAGREAEPP
ncbi:MAG TPA: hypothetical protein VJB57_03010 [Dehalococcoidia bacterium]|nr:hypothetical protein [Dehalococcoidia bacterium]